MQDKQKFLSNNKWIFIYLLSLTLFFILLEISFFIQSNGFYLGDFKLVSYHLKIPMRIFFELAYYLAIQLLLHFLFVLLIWSMTLLISRVFSCSQDKTEKIGLVLWSAGISLILLANQYLYPDSKFAELLGIFLPTILANTLLIIVTVFFAIASLIALYGLIISLYQHRKITAGLISIGLLATLSFTQYHPATLLSDAATPDKPNIIIIGVDSLRPDFLGYFGDQQLTPHLDQFLNQATVFSDALTPLARTYPAWVSILTGVYPKKDGVRFNLAETIHFDMSDTLPAILQRNGYETIFATDETRFSNIDQRFGFDQVITPPMGFNDFLIGTLNDFPLSNLIVNTAMGRYLFPHSYGNRPAYTTYDPNTFLDMLRPELAKPRHKPLFFTVHFCLTHYPYLWPGRAENASPLHNYEYAVYRVDQQVGDLLNILKQNKLLDHTIVVLLSDHGEAIELAGDRITAPELYQSHSNKIPRFYPPTLADEKVDQSAGHGTDVLGLPQYHVVLAFRFFGWTEQQAALVPGRVSLLDIKPTLLSLLGLSEKYQDGKSLSDFIRGKKTAVSSQSDFFIESDFSPEAIRSVHPETRDLVFAGIDFFQINPATTRLSIRPSMVNLILSSKQYADFYQQWVLALYPQNKYWMMPVLVNLESGEWTTDLRSPLAKQAPTQHMLTALKNFYRSDLTSIKNFSY